MKKLRAKRGFTLAEMLISVLLLGFMTIMCTVMTSAVLSGTNTMQEVAQAEILGSVALENLEKEVRLAKNLRFRGDTVVFDSTSFDKGCSPAVKDGKICMDAAGTLLFDGSSYGDLQVEKLTFSPSEDKTSVVIAVSVSYGGKVLWNSEVAVKPINGIAV